MGEKLEEIFVAKSLSNKLFLKEELYSLKKEEGRMDEVYKSEHKAMMLLTYLPSSYKHLRMMLMFGKRTLKHEKVMQDILTNDIMVQHFEVVSQGERLVGKSGREVDSESVMARRTIGEDQNPSLKTVVLNVGQKIIGRRIVLHGERRETKGRSWMKLESQRIAMVSFYLLISLCSYHMCSNKSWFDTYDVDYDIEFMIGDSSVCRVEGIGTIKVKMHDGVVRTLGMVRYIPKLKKNLISLGTFDKNGYSYKAKGGKLIISKNDSKDTQHWHLRLRHMIEGDIQVARQREYEHRGARLYSLGNVGLAPVKSFGGARYYVTFLDDFSRKV
ncbi:unnamed protein product [Prunus armeniaca]